MSGILLPGDSGFLQLSTKAGTPIPNTRRLPRSPEAMRAAELQNQQNYPGAKVRSLDSTYNCMGLVFAGRRTGIEIEELDRILAEDGYRLVKKPLDVRVSDIVVYRHSSQGKATHVGIVVQAGLMDCEHAKPKFDVLSQWGWDGEYFHSLENKPSIYGDFAEFYTDRVLT